MWEIFVQRAVSVVGEIVKSEDVQSGYSRAASRWRVLDGYDQVIMFGTISRTLISEVVARSHGFFANV